MKKLLVVTFLVIVMSLLFVNGQQVQASGLSTLAVDNLFTSLNAGNMVAAESLFTDEATVTYLDVDRTHVSLENWQRQGRQYRLLSHKVTNVTTGLDMVSSNVEISDSGIAWGRATIITVVYNGQINNLYVRGSQLTPWQYW